MGKVQPSIIAILHLHREVHFFCISMQASVSTPTAEVPGVFSLPSPGTAPTVLGKVPERICYQSQLGKL